MYQVNAFERPFEHIFFITTLYMYCHLKRRRVSAFKEPFLVNAKYDLLLQL